MTKESEVKVVIKAEDEYMKTRGPGSMSPTPSGGGQDSGISANSAGASLGASIGGGLSSLGGNVSPEAGMELAYAQRLETEREFQSQRLQIIRSANFEESMVMGQHSKEQLSKDKENNEIKKGNTKALIGASLSLMSTLMSGSKKNNKAMFEAEKAFSVGKAMMSAYAGASKAFETYSANPPLAGLMAGIALAKGMAMARSIASQKMTRSPGSSGGGLGGSLPSSPGSSTRPYGGLEEDATRGTQNLVVNIHNPLSDENWAKIVEDNIIPAIEDAGDRNVVIDMNA